jgi:3-oxoacyl-[acyl-carrier protein] reductase
MLLAEPRPLLDVYQPEPLASCVIVAGKGTDMTGKRTILVTGATGGIGTPLCERLAKAGHSLILAARDPGRLCDLAQRLGGGHDYISVDMADDTSIETFGQKLSALCRPLDGAVLMPPPLPRNSDPVPSSETWRSYFQASFIGPLALLQTALGEMRPDAAAGRRAKVVIISAISSVQLLGHYAASNVLRPAWLGQAKTLAFALGSRGIHVNTVSLGGILTEHYTGLIAGRARESGQTPEQRLAEETSNVPLGKYGKPEEVAAVIDGLLSEFSDHLTGVNILCDGGFTRAY